MFARKQTTQKLTPVQQEDLLAIRRMLNQNSQFPIQYISIEEYIKKYVEIMEIGCIFEIIVSNNWLY